MLGAMLLATAPTLGRHGYERALREGHLRQLLPGVAAPIDLPLTPGIRALAVAHLMPRRGVVTGLAGLWIHTGSHPTTTIDVIGPREMHRPDVRAGTSLRVRTHVACAPATCVAPGVAVTDPLRCCADALRFSAAVHAFSPVQSFLRGDPAGLGAVAAMVAAVPLTRRGDADAVLTALRAIARESPGLAEAA